ncbi:MULTISPECIES: NUDIX domain-containing protein [unclassified Virgibacillus]|uniref:NUDIX domain-containing protein n=1 Tax=unclassified Virgibacillus TaxID=2620237 RepID=UPI000EF47902|nr:MULTISPECIES: NUDIX domain-containing protein [unclassified Virgibacillus]MDY7045554.1 NUDIX domain-containing protein [Virgibacillus sp. M23]
MIYRKKTYKLKKGTVEAFNNFFHEYLLPNQLTYGANLVGRWVNQSNDEITAMWAYNNMEEYERIEANIRASDLHKMGHKKRKELGDIIIDSRQEFLTSTGNDQYPKHIVSVSGYITNDQGEVLLVRNMDRADTMEIPGGQVEEEESLLEAVHREIKEETGAIVQMDGITGIYQNVTKGIINIVFRGKYISGDLRTQEEETTEVCFRKLTPTNTSQYITREHFLDRVLDAMHPTYIPYEAFEVRPHHILHQLRPSIKQEQ